MKLAFVTTNEHKLLTAKHVCSQFGIEVVPKTLELQEIQSEYGEEIASYKARQAYDKFKQPLAVTDDLWLIPGLNNFPGPYMKQMNKWLTPDDFLRLTKPLKDRRIILRHCLCYQDARRQKSFTVDIEGTLLSGARGDSPYPHFTITSFDGGKHSAAEINAAGYTAINDHHTAWHELCEWLKTNQATVR